MERGGDEEVGGGEEEGGGGGEEEEAEFRHVLHADIQLGGPHPRWVG